MKKSFFLIMVLLAFLISLTISGCNCCDPDTTIAVNWPAPVPVHIKKAVKKTVTPQKELRPQQERGSLFRTPREDPR